MPRTGGIYTAPAGTKGVPNTTIQSAPYNALIDDLVQDANAARPITAGGTGATNATDARTNLGALASADLLTAPTKAVPVDNDTMLITDSEDAGKLKRVLWSVIKAKLKEFFDPIYQASLGYTPVNKAGDTLTGTLQGRSSGGMKPNDKLSGAEQAAFYAPSAGGLYVDMGDKRTAPFATSSSTTGSSFAPLISHRYIHNDKWGGQYTLGVINLNEASQGAYELVHCNLDGAGLRRWTFDGRNGDFTIEGSLRIQNGANYLAMKDTDTGQTRYVHHNDGRIGFLKSDGNWAMHVGDGGDVWTAQLGDLNAQIEKRANEWGQRHANNCVTQSRFAGWVSAVLDTGEDGNDANFDNSGYVVTRVYKARRFRMQFDGRQPQLYVVHRGWFALGTW